MRRIMIRFQLRLYVVIFASFTGLLLLACGEQKPPYQPSKVPVSSLTVTSVDVITASLPLIVVPSLDGQHMAGQSKEGACIYDSAGMKQVCSKTPEKTVFEYIRWSPDSRHIAFSESYQQFHDPDIWIMDADSGKLTNLTEDNVDEIGKGTPNKEKIDTLPVWSSNSKQLFFVRYSGASEDSLGLGVDPLGGSLWSRDIPGGSATLLANLNTTLVTALAPSQDGKGVAYWSEESGWLLDIESMKNKNLGAGRFVHDLQFSPDGRYLLVFDTTNINLLDWDKASSYLLPVGGSGRQEIAGGAAHYATWSADGVALAYVRLRQTQDPYKSGIYITEAPDKLGKLVYEGDLIAGSLEYPLVWASDNTILVNDLNKRSTEGNLLRLHLGTK
jgi:dipeptidyl aminopeptidase/acylaminoacyl peptidase